MNKKIIKKLINTYGISSDTQLIDLANKIKIPLNYVGFAENMPNKLNNGGYIINLGDLDKSGTHWTCLYIENENAFYFDSFAGAPEDIIIKKLKKNKVKNLIYNDYFQMQDIEETLCGIWCILFLYYMTFSKKTHLMDRFKEFTKNFIDLDGNYSSGSFII